MCLSPFYTSLIIVISLLQCFTILFRILIVTTVADCCGYSYKKKSQCIAAQSIGGVLYLMAVMRTS